MPSLYPVTNSGGDTENFIIPLSQLELAKNIKVINKLPNERQNSYTWSWNDTESWNET